MTTRVDISIRNERKAALFRKAYAALVEHLQCEKPLSYTDAIEIMSSFLLWCLQDKNCRELFDMFIAAQRQQQQQ